MKTLPSYQQKNSLPPRPLTTKHANEKKLMTASLKCIMESPLRTSSKKLASEYSWKNVHSESSTRKYEFPAI